MANSDLLSDLAARTVDKLPVSVVSDGRGNSVQIPPVPITLSLSLETNALLSGDLGAFYDAVGATAEQQREALERAMLATITTVTELTGNTTDAGGAGWSYDLLTDAMEKLDMEFDEHGQPVGIQIVMHPDDYAKLQSLVETQPPTEAQTRRHAEMLERKHAEWLAKRRQRRL